MVLKREVEKIAHAINKAEKKLENSNAIKIILIGIWAFIFLYLLIFIIIPFLRYGSVTNWDMAGHYFSAWYQKEYLFPNVIGWNPYFFLGHPQNQFYPPLYFYLTALLAQVFSLELSFKLVLAMALLLMPFAFYYFVRSFEISKMQSSSLMLFMFSLLFVSKYSHIGGDLHSTFDIGLVSHLLGLMLFFFYFGSLIRGVKANKFLLASVLLALLALTHVVVAFAGAIAFISIAFSSISDRKSSLFFIKHGTLAFLLSAFWAIPFLAKINYLNSVKIGYFSPYLYLILGGILIYSAISSFQQNKKFYPIAFFLLIMLFLSILGSSYSNMPFHFYRLTLFMVLLFPLAFVSLFKKEFKLISLLFIFVSLFIILSSPHLEIRSEKIPDLQLLTNTSDGRIFVVASPNKESQPHFLQHEIPKENKAIALRGLYVESSKNGAFVLNLEKEIDKNSLAWGNYIHYDLLTNNSNKSAEILPYQFNLFNVNYVVSFHNSSNNLTKEWKELEKVTTFISPATLLELYDYTLYKVGNSSLIEVLDYKPRMVNLTNATWYYASMRWFLSEDIKKGTLVNEEVPDSIGTGKEKVDILNISKRQDYIKFKVYSDKDVPILIKISEFPNWRAYSNGKKLKIYRASPYLMLVYSNGEIELKYEKIFSDKLGEWLSILGLIIFVFLMINSCRKINSH